jgi:hypothetical protein
MERGVQITVVREASHCILAENIITDDAGCSTIQVMLKHPEMAARMAHRLAIRFPTRTQCKSVFPSGHQRFL